MSATKGIYVQRLEDGRVFSVQVRDGAGIELPVDPDVYIRRGYEPPIDMLPGLSEYKADGGNALTYVDTRPDTVQVKVEDLRVGFVHVTLMPSGKYELGKIHEVSHPEKDMVKFRFGYVGHSMRQQYVGKHVDILRASIPPTSQKRSETTDQ